MVVISLKEKAFRQIRDEIVNNKLTPGQPLKERDLAKELNVSTTPIREALQLLWKEGFVEIFPNKGCFVSQLRNNDIHEIMELRYALEPIAASDAALKYIPEALNAFEIKYESLIDEDFNEAGNYFHRFLVESTKKQKLIDIISNLSFHINRLNIYYLGQSPQGFRDQVLTEHQAILDAVRDRNSKQAEKEMRRHIGNYWKRLKKVF